jgi:predicted nucleotidyltransferase
MPTETVSHKFGLIEGTLAKMHTVFARYPQINEVRLYGSRAKGNYKRGSDIDLVIVSPAMTLAQLLALENELDDLLLPYKIDISLLDQIDNPDLLEHIERVGLKFY